MKFLLGRAKWAISRLLTEGAPSGEGAVPRLGGVEVLPGETGWSPHLRVRGWERVHLGVDVHRVRR